MYIDTNKVTKICSSLFHVVKQLGLRACHFLHQRLSPLLALHFTCRVGMLVMSLYVAACLSSWTRTSGQLSRSVAVERAFLLFSHLFASCFPIQCCVRQGDGVAMSQFFREVEHISQEKISRYFHNCLLSGLKEKNPKRSEN